METRKDLRIRFASAAIAALAWFGVLLQLWLSIRLAQHNGKSAFDGLIALLGYFTVLTNLFVALVFSQPFVFGDTRFGRWLGGDMLRGCATTSIAMVGIAYHFLLRNVWAPEGWQWVADVALHYATPLAALGYWLAFPPARALALRSVLIWCPYPAAYLLYALVRGELLGSYPYHFIDVGALGYGKVLVNSLWLLLGFVLVGGAIVGLARRRVR
ncbi:putative membrane protein [Lysobacter antibioticus]|uniref:Pr6Pr family membrane protein n=1 Tax=Lysobacter antibioticus TaxID=84531 RepID=UPI0007173A42|nr:Pr6Pr family membrane protein [Lysobacter antibioticus]ALN61227.1 putative membrane protein [Lysobacter antibioticus]